MGASEGPCQTTQGASCSLSHHVPFLPPASLPGPEPPALPPPGSRSGLQLLSEATEGEWEGG